MVDSNKGVDNNDLAGEFEHARYGNKLLSQRLATHRSELSLPGGSASPYEKGNLSSICLAEPAAVSAVDSVPGTGLSHVHIIGLTCRRAMTLSSSLQTYWGSWMALRWSGTDSKVISRQGTGDSSDAGA